MIALLTHVQVAAAQMDGAADTLDWRSYYPLQIGNVWEYRHTEELPDFSLETVVGDTTLDNRRYFKIRYEKFNRDLGGLFSSSERYVRYDSSGRIVVLDDISQDTSAVDIRDHLLHSGHDLRVAIGDTVYSETGEVLSWTEGAYSTTLEISGRSYDVPALKRFVSPLWRESYASGIGFLGGGNLWGRNLTYARVGGEEFGLRQVDTHVARASDDLLERVELEIYPNPAIEEITFHLHIPRSGRVTLRLYNSAGQRVWDERRDVPLRGTYHWRFDTSGLASGVYLVRIQSSMGGQSEGRVVVIK